MPPRRLARTPSADADVYLDWPEVHRRTTLSRTTIWRLERGEHFPRHVNLSPSRVAWREKDIQAWMKTREANKGHYVGGD